MLLKNLATILPDELLQDMLSKREVSILSILPYRDDYAALVTLELTKAFLQKLSYMHLPEFEFISMLYPLFIALKKLKNNDSFLVAKAIVEKMLTCPVYLEDSEFIISLKKQEGINEIVEEQLMILETKFNDGLAKNLHDFSQEKYFEIEDIWGQVSEKARILNKIINCTSILPPDIYCLQALIAKELFSIGAFNLSSFCSKLNIIPEISKNTKTKFEHLLTEIVIRIDDNFLRQEILQTLFKKYKSQDNKHEFILKLLQEAVVKNNQGLFTDFFIPDRLTEKYISTLLEEATKRSHWQIVKLILKHPENPNIDIQLLQKVLAKASIQGEIKILNKVCTRLLAQDSKKAARLIEEAFLRVIVDGNNKSFLYFLSIESLAQNELLMFRAFQKAFESGSLGMAKQLYSSCKENRLTQCFIQSQLINAAKTNNLKHLFFIFEREADLSISLIEKAFITSLSLGFHEFTLHLCELFKMPRQHALEETLKSLASGGALNEIKFLIGFPNIKFRQCALEKSFIAAAMKGKHLVMEYFSMHMSRNAKVSAEALFLASREGHLGVIEFILNSGSVNFKALQKAITTAEKNGFSEIEMFLKRARLRIKQTSNVTPVMKRSGLDGPKSLQLRLFGKKNGNSSNIQNSCKYIL